MTAADPVEQTPGLLESMWRYRLMTLLLAVLFAGLGVASTLLVQQAPSVARFAVKDPTGNELLGGSSSSSSRVTSQRAAFARTDVVLEDARQRADLGDLSLATVRSLVTTTADDDADLVSVTVAHSSSEVSARLADAVVAAYRAQTQRQVEQLRDDALETISQTRSDVLGGLEGVRAGTPSAQAGAQTLAALDSRRVEVSVDSAVYGDGVAFVDAATRDSAGAGLGTLVRNAAAGLLVGLLLAAVVAYVRADRNGELAHADEPARVLGAPLLSEVPELRGGRLQATLTDLRRMPAASFEFAATSLRSAVPTGLVLVVGMQDGEGRTTAAASLAVAAARDGLRVALVDADVRNGDVLRFLPPGTGSSRGLTAVALDVAALDGALLTVPVSGRNALAVLPAGELVEDLPSLFRSGGMQDALRALRARFDLVVVDCPAAGQYSETLALAPHADAAVVIVRSGASRTQLTALRRRLELTRVQVVGYIFNRSGTASDVHVAEVPAERVG